MEDLIKRWTRIEKIKRQLLIDTLRKHLVHTEDPVTCSAGEKTTIYANVPGALSNFHDLRLAAGVFSAHLRHEVTGVWDLIGGPQTGAIPLVLGMAMEHWDDERQWFILRDKPKKHGLGLMYVGGGPGPGDKVILTDDVVSSGDSLVDAYAQIQETGARVVAVVPLLDRGNKAQTRFDARYIPYRPVLTYTDLDIPPLGAS